MPVLTMKVTTEELERLSAQAKARGISRSALMRERLFKGKGVRHVAQGVPDPSAAAGPATSGRQATGHKVGCSCLMCKGGK